MYGLEKKPQTMFEMDLARDLKKNPAKAQEILKSVEKNMQEIKNSLRGGAKGPEFDKLGTLLQGYAAVKKVLQKLTK